MQTCSSAISHDDKVVKKRLLYGRRSAGRLRPYRKSLIRELLPDISIDLPDAGLLDPRTLFSPERSAIWLEIGFGGGEHLAARAAANADLGFIGVEPFLSGVARLLSEIDCKTLSNIRLLADDARLLLNCLTPACLARVLVLFPDPWPKMRHHKRRIVNPTTLQAIAWSLAPGGLLQIATDHTGYAHWILKHALNAPNLEWQAEAAADWLVRPVDQPSTRYEQKALKAGRETVFLTFIRI